MGSYLIDGFVVLIFVLIVVHYTRQGFASSVIGLLRFWIAVGFATLFSSSLGEVLQPVIEGHLDIGEEGGFFSMLLQEFVASGYLAKALAFFLIFVATSILIKLIEMIVNTLTKLPVINLINRLLGAAVGIAIGFFWVELLAFGAISLADYLNEMLTFLPEGALEHTVVLQWLYDHNIFRWIVSQLLAAVGR